MKRSAMTVAAVGFFGLAIIGWLSGVGLLLCGLRALAGAAVLYVLTVLLGRATGRLLADAAMSARKQPQQRTRDGSE